MSVVEKIRPSTEMHTLANKPILRIERDRSVPEAAEKLPDDGTGQLLRAGFWIVLFGLAALLATLYLFGGIGIYGAHSNAGWLSFMFAMMSVPFGLMLLLLGGAKWLRNRRRQHRS